MHANRRYRPVAKRGVAARYHAFRRSEEGSVAIEYGLIAALVVIVIIVTLVQLRENLLSLPFPKLLAAFSAALSP